MRQKEEERVRLEREAQKAKDEMWQLEFERRKLEEESKIAQLEVKNFENRPNFVDLMGVELDRS